MLFMPMTLRIVAFTDYSGGRLFSHQKEDLKSSSKISHSEIISLISFSALLSHMWRNVWALHTAHQVNAP